MLLLYREVLDVPVESVADVEPTKAPEKMPVVFNRNGARAVIGRLRGEAWLMTALL